MILYISPSQNYMSLNKFQRRCQKRCQTGIRNTGYHFFDSWIPLPGNLDTTFSIPGYHFPKVSMFLPHKELFCPKRPGKGQLVSRNRESGIQVFEFGILERVFWYPMWYPVLIFSGIQELEKWYPVVVDFLFHHFSLSNIN